MARNPGVSVPPKRWPTSWRSHGEPELADAPHHRLHVGRVPASPHRQHPSASPGPAARPATPSRGNGPGRAAPRPAPRLNVGPRRRGAPHGASMPPSPHVQVARQPAAAAGAPGPSTAKVARGGSVAAEDARRGAPRPVPPTGTRPRRPGAEPAGGRGPAPHAPPPHSADAACRRHHGPRRANAATAWAVASGVAPATRRPLATPRHGVARSRRAGPRARRDHHDG